MFTVLMRSFSVILHNISLLDVMMQINVSYKSIFVKPGHSSENFCIINSLALVYTFRAVHIHAHMLSQACTGILYYTKHKLTANDINKKKDFLQELGNEAFFMMANVSRQQRSLLNHLRLQQQNHWLGYVLSHATSSCHAAFSNTFINLQKSVQQGLCAACS